jgi:hypothetical protein
MLIARKRRSAHTSQDALYFQRVAGFHGAGINVISFRHQRELWAGIEQSV